MASEKTVSAPLYKVLRNLGTMKSLLPMKLYTESYDAALYKLFEAIINAGTKMYSSERKGKTELTATNFMKLDEYYYSTLNDYWDDLEPKINEVFSDV